MKKLFDKFHLPILALSIYAIFHKLFEEIISKSIVTPILSKASFSGNIMGVLGYLLVLFLISRWFVLKIRKRYTFSDSWLLWSVVITLVYIYYRFFSDTWSFYSLIWIVKVTDVIFLIPLVLLLAKCNSSDELIADNDKNEKELGFLCDTPAKNDDFERSSFIEHLERKILNTDSSEESFCIGIVGPWGTGKTTFINLLMKKFENSKSIIQFKFSPWLKETNSSVVEVFFEQFSSNLEEHTDVLRPQVLKYTKVLLKEDNSSWIGQLFEFFVPFLQWNKADVDTLKNNINKNLKRLRKKVVIYVDDIDRLDKEEIQDIFKLVRNSAGFANVFYVIAFDKVQVENSLKERFSLGNKQYLEKIFQAEFHLPPVKSYRYLEKLKQGLLERVDVIDKEFTKELFVEIFEFGHVSHMWLKGYINHQRDVVRFLNVFDLYYSKVEGNLYFPDFLTIMVLKFKYPDFHYYFYKNYSYFLKFKIRNDGSKGNNREFALDVVDEKSRTYDGTILYESLKQGIPEANINPGDFGPLRILEKVFDLYEGNKLPNQHPKSKSGDRNYLRISYEKYFFLYFDYSFSGQITDVIFQKAINENKHEFLSTVSNWCLNDEDANTAVHILENINIYTDLSHFEKVVEALILITNHSDGKYEIDEAGFIRRFDLNSKSNKKRLLTIFGNSEEAVGNYLYKLIKDNAKLRNFCYRLAKEAMSDETVIPLLSKEGAADIVRAYCELYFKSKFSYDERFYFQLFASDWIASSSVLNEESPAGKIVDKIIAELDNTINLLVIPCHEHKDEGYYRLNDGMITMLYPGIESLIERIKTANQEAAEELSCFNELIKNKEKHGCAMFNFKVLNVLKVKVENES